jgi:hypothetical protein
VLAKPNVIMNDIRLRGLAVGGSEAAETSAVPGDDEHPGADQLMADMSGRTAYQSPL